MKIGIHARLAGGACGAAAVLAVLALAALPATRPALAQTLSGLDVYRSNCTGCHDLYDPEDPKRSRKEWDEILTRMVKQRGATLNKQEYAAVLNYLDSFNRERREIRWLEEPAKSRKVAFDPKDSGKLPPEWVDVTGGGDVEIPWAVQGDAAGKTAYVQPLKSAEQGHYPILVDNTGLVESGGAATRLQIVSGKGAVGAGIVFGFRNPQSYYGVRVSPRDVVLYEVQGGRPALLARASTPAPLKQWHTLGVQVAGKDVKVTLNGKPVPELARSIGSYRGGRFGIHTQGDTVAMFDQWQLDVK
jgi:hypothetical protein